MAHLVRSHLLKIPISDYTFLHIPFQMQQPQQQNGRKTFKYQICPGQIAVSLTQCLKAANPGFRHCVTAVTHPTALLNALSSTTDAPTQSYSKTQVTQRKFVQSQVASQIKQCSECSFRDCWVESGLDGDENEVDRASR